MCISKPDTVRLYISLHRQTKMNRNLNIIVNLIIKYWGRNEPTAIVVRYSEKELLGWGGLWAWH